MNSKRFIWVILIYFWTSAFINILSDLFLKNNIAKQNVSEEDHWSVNHFDVYSVRLHRQKTAKVKTVKSVVPLWTLKAVSVGQANTVLVSTFTKHSLWCQSNWYVCSSKPFSCNLTRFHNYDMSRQFTWNYLSCTLRLPNQLGIYFSGKTCVSTFFSTLYSLFNHWTLIKTRILTRWVALLICFKSFYVT